jgi:glycosyltransferase involved in cell wall biosynthesis
MNPSVSVVIPTYNRARDLRRALGSVLAQTYTDWEALIVDNHSADDTDDVIKGFGDPRLRLFKINNSGVIAASRNLGIRHAHGEFVAFLDSDDYWRPDKLESSMAWLRRGYDVVYHDMHIVSDRPHFGGARKFNTRQLTAPAFNDLLVNGNTLPTSSVVTRRELLVRAGGFREDVDIVAGEDFDLWLRVSTLTERFKRMDGTLGSLWRSVDSQFSCRRFISVISEIEKRYLCALTTEEQQQARVNWIDYNRARSLYKSNECDEAVAELLAVVRGRAKLPLRVKALYMLAGVAMNRLKGARS